MVVCAECSSEGSFTEISLHQIITVRRSTLPECMSSILEVHTIVLRYFVCEIRQQRELYVAQTSLAPGGVDPITSQENLIVMSSIIQGLILQDKTFFIFIYFVLSKFYYTENAVIMRPSGQGVGVWGSIPSVGHV